MADRDAIRDEIERLVEEGKELYQRELVANASPKNRERIQDLVAADPSRAKLLEKPDFGTEYQAWYSQALRVVQQLLPDRYDEFRAHYKDERRKALDLEAYGIADYIAGLRPLALAPGSVRERGMGRFGQQVAIVSTAKARLDSVLTDIGRTVHGEILDDELAEARRLLAESYLRPSGVVAGVALEAHLKKLIVDHKVSFRKKSQIGNLNDALKDAGVYDVPQWRRIQHLADVRNLCGHKGEREPKWEEVEDLINETAKIVKTVF